MAKKKIHEGKCAICGSFGRLSFEHIPPRSAFNDKPILIQDHEKLFVQSSPVFGKHSKSNKGFGRYTLCESCNNQTGDWYARDFTEFAKRGMELLKLSEHPTQVISGPYKIKPLNVLKQICAMFMAISPGWLQIDKSLVSFILDKESKDFPQNYQVFMYSTFSKYKRMIGMQIVHREGKVSKWAEFNFQPFGFLLCDESDPPNEFLANITSFSQFQLDQEIEVKITTPLLHIKEKDIWVGTYDNVE